VDGWTLSLAPKAKSESAAPGYVPTKREAEGNLKKRFAYLISNVQQLNPE
jgi:hypothetical protein